ncbi:hypothetical protein NQ318_017309 [Aromia moschata]|uniref:Uncharacterized protein n=1 Tax=Aromia moschata TaxID=1265417 RepID=A0AAV8XW70_9CUCU|nr:hypothetical protein NQ318_017309 [Aromia moschata]
MVFEQESLVREQIIFLLSQRADAGPSTVPPRLRPRQAEGEEPRLPRLPPPDADYPTYDVNDDDYISMALEENDLARTVPARKRLPPQPYNSPIYYIRMPPQPYMFVPGLGYISQPAPSPLSQFVNLPVPFVANGKPSAIYQWSGAFEGAFPTAAPPPAPAKKPTKESAVHRLPGTYTFNGKPEDIYVLRDSYNSLFSDVLQNVYP